MITCECFVLARSGLEPLEPFSAVGAIESGIGREVEKEKVSGGENASATGEKRKGEYGDLRATRLSVRRTGLSKEGKFIH